MIGCYLWRCWGYLPRGRSTKPHSEWSRGSRGLCRYGERDAVRLPPVRDTEPGSRSCVAVPAALGHP
jgi:hypothetical protein